MPNISPGQLLSLYTMYKLNGTTHACKELQRLIGMYGVHVGSIIGLMKGCFLEVKMPLLQGEPRVSNPDLHIHASVNTDPIHMYIHKLPLVD